MATLKTLPVVGDSGSQELAQLLSSYNQLLDILGTLITGMKTVADEAALHVLATTAETAMEANVLKIVPTYQVPLARHFATK